MIFVTVGSRNYPFDRLFKKLDELYEDGLVSGPMFAQIGTAAYKPRHYEYKDFISPDEFAERINEADIVVSHGASGSIMKALNAGKKVIAVTRLEKYGEHINDHQIQNNEAFSSNGYVLMADLELNNLAGCFQRIQDGTDGLKKWENKDPMAIVDMIDRFIQENYTGGLGVMGSSKMIKKVRYALRFLPDKPYIQLNYFAHFGRFANLRKPVTYNEKLNWYKLHDRNPLYTKLVDKYEVKKYVSEILGGYIVPTLGVWDCFDDINFDELPNRFVLKCTHDSEGLVIVKDKNIFGKFAAREKIEHCLKQNFFYIGREWPYKNVKPRIIAEQYLEDETDGELRDYKFFCFNGIPKAMYIASGRGISQTKVDYYDMDFNHLDITQKYPNADTPRRKPERFDEMVALAKKLSSGIPHVRVDFYQVNGKIYFGEMTFYHLSGFVPFKPPKWDYVFGDWLELPEDKSV